MESRDEQIDTIFKTITLLFNGVKKKTNECLSFLKKLFFFTIGFTIIMPIIFMTVVIHGADSLIAWVGIISVGVTLLLLVLFAPLGIPTEVLWGGLAGSAERYINLSKKILIIELCVILFAWIVPIKNNPGYVFPLIITAVLLGYLGAHIFYRKVIVIVLTIIFLFLLRGFFLPESSKELTKLPSLLDKNFKSLISNSTTPNQPSKQKLAPGGAVKDAIPPFNNFVKNLKATGITLMPGDSLQVAKDSSTPAIPLFLKFSDGEEREYPASFWGTIYMNYTHTGKIVRGRSATIFYQGEVGKYNFQKIPNANTISQYNKAVEGLNPTGITLQPGEKIVGTKNPYDPPVELVVRFPDGETIIINSKHWTSRNIELTHVGHNVKGRPGEIFYRGRAEKYHFQKTPDKYLSPAE